LRPVLTSLRRSVKWNPEAVLAPASRPRNRVYRGAGNV
jgi:hypothetical protein